MQSSSTFSSQQLPLISPSDKWGNIATLCTAASISQTLGKTTSIGRLLGPPVTAMAIAFVLGSIGILPGGGTDHSRALQLLSIQIATPLLLLGADIRECRQSCGPLLIGFILASIGTILGSICAIPIIGHSLTNVLGPEGIKIAAALMAKNIGGGVNYVAVCQSLNATPIAIAAGLAVDNVFALIYFPIISLLASGRPDVEDHCNSRNRNMPIEDKNEEVKTTGGGDNEMNTETVSSAIAFACIITWLGTLIGGQSASLPISTLLTVIYTTVFPKRARNMRSIGETVGTTCLYIFFATAGAPGLSIADSLRDAFWPISVFLLILYGVHGLFLYSIRSIVLTLQGRRKQQQQYLNNGKEKENQYIMAPQRLLVASSAAIGGPSTAAALAKAQGWESLISPSLIVGNLGYAIATFLGVGFHLLFKSKKL